MITLSNEEWVIKNSELLNKLKIKGKLHTIEMKTDGVHIKVLR